VRFRGLLAAALLAAVAGCAAPKPPPDIPVGPLGFPFDVDADSVNSFVCANDKHFSIAYLDWGIVFSTGVGGVMPMKIVGSDRGVRYDGGKFTVITTANRAIVYYDQQPVMLDCFAIMQ
jgi:membrane-bound inhibitor of C-type lysozyme